MSNDFLSEKYIEILKLIKSKERLSSREISLFTGDSVFDISKKLVYLFDNKFIKKKNFGITPNGGDVVSMDDFFCISTKGEEHLEYVNHENNLFRNRSIYTPIGVSIVTAVLTTFIIKLLFG